MVDSGMTEELAGAALEQLNAWEWSEWKQFHDSLPEDNVACAASIAGASVTNVFICIPPTQLLSLRSSLALCSTTAFLAD